MGDQHSHVAKGMNLEKWGALGVTLYSLLHSACHREGRSEVMKREVEPRAGSESGVSSLPPAASVTSTSHLPSFL